MTDHADTASRALALPEPVLAAVLDLYAACEASPLFTAATAVGLAESLNEKARVMEDPHALIVQAHTLVMARIAESLGVADVG